MPSDVLLPTSSAWGWGLEAGYASPPIPTLTDLSICHELCPSIECAAALCRALAHPGNPCYTRPRYDLNRRRDRLLQHMRAAARLPRVTARLRPAAARRRGRERLA